MNPETGTFISMDTYRGNAYDPASLHRYTYAQNNPQMYNDPSGHFAMSIGQMVANVGRGILRCAINSTIGGLIGGVTSCIYNMTVEKPVSLGEAFKEGFKTGARIALAYTGVCALFTYAKLKTVFHVIMFGMNATMATYDLVLALAYGVTGNDSKALFYLAMTVVSLIGAFIELGMSGWITINGMKGSATIGTSNDGIPDSKTYYHVTTAEKAEQIISTGELGIRGNKWEARVFAWTKQPTQKQASIAGIGKDAQIVIKFNTNASFQLDKGNATKSISNIVVETTDGQRIPISIKDIEIVGFKKEWWQFWKK